MKRDRFFHVLCFLIAGFTFMMPFVGFAQQSSVMGAAKATAEQDAEADVNNFLWLGAGLLLSGVALFDSGCLFSAAGLAGCYFYQPFPPTERFVGKSPEYITIYANTYKSKIGSLQARWAAAGCVGGGLIIFVLVKSTFSIGGHVSVSLDAP